MRKHKPICMSVRKWLFWIGVGLFASGLTGCLHSPDKPRWPAAEFDWPLDHTGSRAVRLLIPAGYNLGVAADAMERMVYPDGRPKDPHNVQADMLLETLWPEMAPRTRGNDEEFKVRGGGRTLTILIKSGAIDPEAHAVDRLHMSLNATISVYLSRVCVPRNQPNNTCFEVEDLSSKPERFGLKHVGIDFAQYPGLAKDAYHHYKDIYYTPDLGEGLETYIRCDPDEAEPFTRWGGRLNFRCTQDFIFEPLNARVGVSYRRIYLEDWSEIQSSIETLLQSFIVKQ